MNTMMRTDRSTESLPISIGELRGRRRAFTLIEMLISVAIISILATISTLGFRKITESNVLAQAKNVVLTYAKIARSYAVANQIETMLVVNPFNGRFEIWHANPAPFGGPWDPLSEGTAPPLSDGYAFAPVLDSGARLPVDSRGRPLAAVHPIDYLPVWRPQAVDERHVDNLTWSAFCFDKNGELVIRTRRIATRTYTRRDGTLRPAPDQAGGRNRLIDETPDLALFLAVPAIPMVITGADGDTAITSTSGFVISDATKMRKVLGTDWVADPSVLVNEWLVQTQPTQPYAGFAETVVLNRFSGDELSRERQ